MLKGKETNTSFIVFGLTRPGLKLTIYCTRGEHANHDTTDAVTGFYLLLLSSLVSKVTFIKISVIPWQSSFTGGGHQEKTIDLVKVTEKLLSHMTVSS